MAKKKQIIFIIALLLLRTSLAFAFSDSEAQLENFLEGIADFLIRVIGPGILVIGVCMGGISMATGDERGQDFPLDLLARSCPPARD